MLLERRDRERGVELALAPLTRTDKSLILQDVAFWLIRNGWSDAPTDRVAAQVARSLLNMHRVSSEPAEVFHDLMERSGLLREPAAGRVDFVHRTFQEYLAAKAAVDSDEIGQQSGVYAKGHSAHRTNRANATDRVVFRNGEKTMDG